MFALANLSAKRVIPCQFCTFTISTILGSAILYRDFERMSVRSIAMFISGCLLTFLGVWITSSQRATAERDFSIDPPLIQTTSSRFKRTISTILSEQSPLMNDVLPGARPHSRRLKSSNAQTGPLLNYFVAKAENTHKHGSFNGTTFSYSPNNNSLLRPPVDIGLQSSSV